MPVTLQPIAITTANKHCIYSFSKLRQIKELGYTQFWDEYVDQSRKVLVCFSDDPPTLDNSKTVKAYGFSYTGWYIVIDEGLVACEP